MAEAIPGYETTKEILKEGAGSKVVQKGSTATVHATGVIKETGKKFWSTKDPGQKPFTYQAGVGKVITGWDQGCLGMQVGEERRLVIPGKEGYGAAGFPAWGIPPNGTLEFTLECLDVQ
mmetsp:Transcript_67386/g.152378  ORF Transcript_67386/g.152378 Transcript_67386/m.152378 type:complete len:119 (+) Transcript_67386:80-436(+)